jgi:putative oxidoreductase
MNMSNPVLTPFVSSKQMLSSGLGTCQRLATFYARFALGAAFLSAVSARFGLCGENTGPDSFKHFIEYTGEVNSFMPAFMVPFLAWAATVTETCLGIALVLGIWPRFVALAAAGLLALFGTAMAISFGIKSPLDYSVFSASAAALLLSTCQSRREGGNL